ncbi:MAG: undecaprenyldiphospho-muramoylpentapeptide beta-N-acetylglucosaminyltransferase [Flavobacteriales bacterium]|jgi:UDP-N-acetylglucosamine--N-acetylmuramyl-(pentapeptide) pyrophosphoryl-undecaprenol N-acetylglucosamine transferase|nr:undecaprenyldiphospho-muramoylpentapeptide beta-N-acetylglucosaminyltransferase [Flavobacteriales bacterium]
MSYKFIISGGGTGGHIFPAIAIANELMVNYPDSEILFVGAKGKMEMKKVPEAGYKIKGLEIVGLQRRLTIKNLFFPFKLLKSLSDAKKIIKEFNPDIVIGVGGYASGPTLRVAGKLGIPTLIQEQNSYAGLTNKLLAKNAKKICVAYDGMDVFFPKQKIVLTGNPVRNDILNTTAKKALSLTHFGLNPNLKTILIIGGSLGARTINESIKDKLKQIKACNVQLLWQTGSYYFSSMKSAVEREGCLNVFPQEFIRKMDFAYAVSDVIISRAGALSVSELCIVGKPVILVPSPNVSEDHQTKNAKSLVDKKAAIHVNDVDSHTKLVELALELVDNERFCKELSTNIKKLAKPNAAKEIVLEIKKLIVDN